MSLESTVDNFVAKLSAVMEQKLSVLRQARDERDYLEFSDKYAAQFGGMAHDEAQSVYRRATPSQRRELLQDIRASKQTRATTSGSVYAFSDQLQRCGVDVDELHRELSALAPADRAAVLADFAKANNE